MSLLAALAYAAYVALFIILPGVVYYGLASRSAQVSFVFAAKATVVGQCVEMSAGLLASMTGAHALYPFLPLLYLAGLVFWWRRILANIEPGEGGPKILPLAISLVAALFLVFAASLFGFDKSIDQHFTWIAAFSNVAVTEWPVREPFLMDVPLYYHYLFNIHVGTAARTFGIPLILVASRLAIIFHGFLFVLMLHAFCQSRFRAGWLGTPAAVQVLLTFGLSSAVMWPYFHFATTLIIFQLASTAVAFEIFLVLCDEILGPSGQAEPAFLRPDRLPHARRQRHPRQSLADAVRRHRRAVACARPARLQAGGVRRAPRRCDARHRRRRGVLPGHRRRQPPMAPSMFLFRPLNVAVSEVQTHAYAPLVRALLAAGLPTPLTVMAYLLVAVLGRMTFLLPGVIFAVVANDSGIERNLRVMLGGVALAGISLLLLIEAVVSQEIWAFYWYADIGFALLGAAGLRALWQRRVTQPVLTAGTLLASTLLFALQLWDFSSGFARKLSVTQFPTPAPVFQTVPRFEELVQTLEQHVVPGDVLVTGGKVGILRRPRLARCRPGSPALCVPYHPSDLSVPSERRPASGLAAMADQQQSPRRCRPHQDPQKCRPVPRPVIPVARRNGASRDRTGLSPVGSWPSMSLWRVE